MVLALFPRDKLADDAGIPGSKSGCSEYFAVPGGHLRELAWNPFFPLKEDGSLVLPA